MNDTMREYSIPADDEVRKAVRGFLYFEAELLDAKRYNEWLELISDRARYLIKAPVVRSLQDTPISVTILDEDAKDLRGRAEQLTGLTHAENPPTQIRHFISNVQVFVADTGDGSAILAKSNVLVHRSSGTIQGSVFYVGRREDMIDRSDGQFRLTERTFFLDQPSPPGPNIAVIL